MNKHNFNQNIKIIWKEKWKIKILKLINQNLSAAVAC